MHRRNKRDQAEIGGGTLIQCWTFVVSQRINQVPSLSPFLAK
jgi:hypothetical protein